MDPQVKRGLGYAAVIAALVGAWLWLAPPAQRGNAPDSINSQRVAPNPPNAPQVAPATVAVGPVPDRLEGIAKVFDADTIEVQGFKLRLDGIDGPEFEQQCGARGREWACGKEAITALRNHLRKRPVACRVAGKDRYDRPLAHCTVGQEDLQRWLVRNGWAMAFFGDDYYVDELAAETARAGLWRDEFIRPASWRKQPRPDQ